MVTGCSSEGGGVGIVVRVRLHDRHLIDGEPLSSDMKTGVVRVAGIANGSIGGQAIRALLLGQQRLIDRLPGYPDGPWAISNTSTPAAHRRS